MAPYMLLNSFQEMSNKNIEMSNENNTVYSVSIVYTLASILLLSWVISFAKKINELTNGIIYALK